jgi:hypothetical protein
MRPKIVTALLVCLLSAEANAQALTDAAVQVRVTKVEGPTWYTPGSATSEHKDRQSCDKCFYLGLDEKEEATWCDATFVTAEATTVSNFPLRYDVACDAFDAAGKRLGTGIASETSPETSTEEAGKPPNKERMSRIDTTYKETNVVRLYKVNYRDVVRVECRAQNVQKDDG